MDALGAQHLACRLLAGVPVGTLIELTRDGEDARLLAGDRGVVEGVGEHGVVVSWDRGFSLEIDPQLTPYRRAA
jgi:hypothetical protein